MGSFSSDCYPCVNVMIVLKELEDRVWILTDYDGKPLQFATSIDFKNWFLKFNPNWEAHPIYISHSGLFYTSESEQHLEIPVQGLLGAWYVNPEKIGLKWSLFTEQSSAIQLEKTVFLKGPKAICWAPNLKSALILQNEGWSIVESKWAIRPEVYKGEGGNEALDTLADDLFQLSGSPSAWFRLGGRLKDEYYTQFRLHRNVFTGQFEGQFFPNQGTELNGAQSIEISMEEVLVQHYANYPITSEPVIEPGSRVMGSFGPRSEDLRQEDSLYLHYNHEHKLFALALRILREQRPKRLVTALNEGWDMFMVCAALSSLIPVTVLWSEQNLSTCATVRSIQKNLLEQCRVFAESDYLVIEDPEIKEEELRLEVIRQRTERIVEMSDEILSAHPVLEQGDYYALAYAKQLGKRVHQYWDCLEP